MCSAGRPRRGTLAVVTEPTSILPCASAATWGPAIDEAVHALSRGALVVVPTDTVYGKAVHRVRRDHDQGAAGQGVHRLVDRGAPRGGARTRQDRRRLCHDGECATSRSPGAAHPRTSRSAALARSDDGDGAFRARRATTIRSRPPRSARVDTSV